MSGDVNPRDIGIELVETRLMMRHTDGEWAGYSYEWNAAGTDADRLYGAKVKAIAGDRVCLIGNIDCGQLLPNGTQEDVREAVRAAIAAGAPGGGYILSSSNCIHSSCKPENFMTMVEAAREFGEY